MDSDVLLYLIYVYQPHEEPSKACAREGTMWSHASNIPAVGKWSHPRPMVHTAIHEHLIVMH